MSRGFDQYEQAQENRERELRAGWYCMLKCHSMLSHTVFTWFCDHANAKWIMRTKLQVARVARLALWLSEYYYNLQHLAGTHLRLAIVDAISRLDIPDDPDDKDIFSPFEAPTVRQTISSLYSGSIIRCPSGYELSTDTHARIRQDGVAIVPNAFISKALEYVDAPTIFAMELFGGLPTPAVAMNRAGFFVCATVEKNPLFLDLTDEVTENPSQVFNFNSADLLSRAVLTGDIRLPCITVVHATLDPTSTPAVRTDEVRQVERKLNSAISLVSA